MTEAERYFLLACIYKLLPTFNEGGIAAGLTLTKEAEGVIHEVAHAVTLGIPYRSGKPTMSWAVLRRIDDLSEERSMENEIRTLAAELVILRMLGDAFVAEDSEEFFLSEIEDSQRSMGYVVEDLPGKVKALADEDQAKRDASLVFTKMAEWADI